MAGEEPRGAQEPAADEAPTATTDRADPIPRSIDLALRAAVIALVLALGAIGLAMPASILRGGLAWLGFLLFVVSGWGYLVARIARTGDPDLGQRAVWGISGYIAITGVLVALGVCTRPVILLLVGLGAAGFAWRELATPTPSWQVIRHAAGRARRAPGFATIAIALALLAALQMVAAVSMLDRNPWDDDIAYTPLIKRLLDAGDLIEPFSFRRMSAYGGQTVLGALAAARGSLSNVHLIDHALMFGVALLSIAGMAHERRTQPLWTALLLLVLLLLPNTSINTATHWTGVAMFLALYRAAAAARWTVVGLVGAATCTLRQNFLVVVVLFVGLVLAMRLVEGRRTTSWREAWRVERAALWRIGVVAIASILAWWGAALASNQTFLFPVIGGTWTEGLSLAPEVISWPDRLMYLLWACIETTPIVVVPVLFVLLVVARDARPGQPLRALFVASTLGFLALVHGFVGIPPFDLWRYAFGFSIALTAAMVLEVGAERERAIHLAPLGRWLLLAALVLQLAVTRGGIPKQLAGQLADVRQASALDRRGDPTARVEAKRYAAMQSAIPPGARVAVMLDDPAYLDFSRNQIANLDTPGFASPAPQLPSFRGAEPMRSYLVDAGYRYLAFVRSERSRYFYRRNFWLWRIFNDSELFQKMSAYTIDAIDAFSELATTTGVLYDDEGLVVLDLAAPVRTATTAPSPPEGDEPTRRAAWFRALADREGLHDAWSLQTRADLRFEDGVAALQMIDGEIDDAPWFEMVKPQIARPEPRTPPRGAPIRALYRRAHLRVRGTGRMRLSIRVALALNVVHTHPRLDVSLDGELLASVVADDRGKYQIELLVPQERLAAGWHDLYLVFDSVAEPDKELRDPRVARLEAVEWVPAP
ncbi:MAG: hypothetical protein ACTHU0_25855 [Kofleriaceae bacterium]